MANPNWRHEGKGGKTCRDKGIGICEERHRLEGSRLGVITNRRNGTAFFDPEIRRKASPLGAAVLNKLRYISLVSGMISTPGGIGSNHRRIGVGKDKTSYRELTNEEYELLIALPQESRLAVLKKRQ